MKLKRRYKVLLGVVALFIVALFFVTVHFEKIVKGLVVSRLKGMGLEAKLEDLDLGLLRGTCSVAGLDLSSSQGKPLFAAEELTVNVDLWQAIAGHVDIQNTSVRGAVAQAEFDEGGKLNWLALLTADSSQQPKKPEAENKTSFEIGSIRLNDVKLSISDSRVETPLKSANLDIGELSVDLKRGRVSAEKIQLETPQRQPYVRLGSLKLRGNITYPYQAPLKLDTVEVSELEGRSILNEQGKPMLQVWLEGLARQNDLLAAEETATSSEEPAAEWPGEVTLNDVRFELAYPGEEGETWVDDIDLERLKFDGTRGSVEVSGLAWNNNRKLLAGVPVLKVGSARLQGALEAKPRQLEDVQVKTVDVNLVKTPGAPFDLQRRLTRLLELVLPAQSDAAAAPSTAAEEPAVRLTGTVELSEIHCRAVVEEAPGGRMDNVLQLDSGRIDFKQGALQLAGLSLSDAGGAFEPAALALASVEAEGNLSFPPPDAWDFQKVLVERPVLHLERSPEGTIDLVERLDQLRPGEEAESPPTTPEKDSLRVALKHLKISEMDVTLVDRLASGESVIYGNQAAELIVDDFVYPGGGTDWTRVQFKTAMTSPSVGSIDLQAKLHQESPPNRFEGKLEFDLSDITVLRAYYADKLPVSIQSGQLFLSASGKCEERRLTIPYKFRIASPQLAPRQAAGLNIFQGLSNAGSQTLVNSLKNAQGDLTYEGKISGTLDKPEMVSPWTAMGNILSNQLKTNVANLPGLAGQVGKTAAETVTGGVGAVGDTLKGLLGRKKKEEQQ